MEFFVWVQIVGFVWYGRTFSLLLTHDSRLLLFRALEFGA